MDPRDEIKQKTDLAELIGEYLTLKPSGTDSFKGLCPFHNEKTPSFHVSSDRQIFHCFGCGEGGDCFSFVMKMEGMDFPEALNHLGKKLGIEIKRFSSKEGNERSRLIAINELASKFFHKVLIDSSKAAHARAYVESRGITKELIVKFELGYAPDDWSTLVDFLRTRAFSEMEIVQAGLALRKKSGSGLIDRFRHRVMIPLKDQHGNVVGFTGRSMGDEMPKYMNSPETPIYHKGQLMYGLDLAKSSIKRDGRVVIVEGNLDVVASHKAGVESVVASSGTALSEDQLKLLARYTKTIVFAFDQDAAGLKAARRGIAAARALAFDVRAAILPGGVKDPDELVQSCPEGWVRVTTESVPIMQFLIERVTRGRDLSRIDDKRAVSTELLPALAEMRDVVEREHWLQVVADILSVDSSILRTSIRPVQPVVSTSAKASVDRSTGKPATTQPQKHIVLSKEDTAFLLILGLFVNDPSVYSPFFDQLSEKSTGDETARSLYTFVKSTYDPSVNLAQKTFFERLRSVLERETSREDLLHLLDKSSLLAQTTFQELSPTNVQEQLKNLLQLMQSRSSIALRSALAAKLRQAEALGDHARVDGLMQELKELS